MDEEEFDSLIGSRPFGSVDAMRAEAQFRRCATLASALFGRTSEDLQRQLLASYPEIPSGFDLADFRKLHQHLQMVLNDLSNSRTHWLSRFASFSAAIAVGGQRYTMWEARCEVVRRAIEHLEKH
jgi:hypothetical protein